MEMRSPLWVIYLDLAQRKNHLTIIKTNNKFKQCFEFK